MYKKVLLLVTALMALSVGSRAQTQLFTSSHNELNNADFETVNKEQKIQKWILPDNAVADISVFHGGKIALKLNGKSAQQKIDTILPGETVHFGAWMRGENVQGNAFVKVAGDNTSAQTKPLTGTFDWTWCESTFTLPLDSRKFPIELNPGQSGNVWFDGVTVQRQLPPMQVFLCWPNYRNLLPANNKQSLRAEIEWVDSSALPNSLVLNHELKDKQGKLIARETSVVKNNNETQEIQLALKSTLPIGDYEWNFQLQSSEGNIWEQVSKAIHVVSQMPKVYIDETGRTIRNGKPFFPFGIYLGEKNDDTNEDLARIAKAGFNTILSYRYGQFKPDPERYMNDAQKNNLAVIFSVKDLYAKTPGAYADPKSDPIAITEKLVNQFKDNPALLAWYTNDESAPVSMPRLQNKYDQIKKLDPNHPAFITLFREGQYGKYFSTTDIISSDWYPFGWAPWSDVSKWTQDAKSATRGALGLWTVTQIHNGTLYRGGDKPQDPVYTPTYQAMKNFAFQAIANGANGLLFYSYFDLWYDTTKREKSQAAFDKRWPDVVKVASDINSLIPILENGKDVPVKVLSGAIAVRAIECQNQLYLIAANPDVKVRRLSVQLPGIWKTPNGKTRVANGGTLWEYDLAPRDSIIINLMKGRS